MSILLQNAADDVMTWGHAAIAGWLGIAIVGFLGKNELLHGNWHQYTDCSLPPALRPVSSCPVSRCPRWPQLWCWCPLVSIIAAGWRDNPSKSPIINIPPILLSYPIIFKFYQVLWIFIWGIKLSLSIFFSIRWRVQEYLLINNEKWVIKSIEYYKISNWVVVWR